MGRKPTSKMPSARRVAPAVAQPHGRKGRERAQCVAPKLQGAMAWTKRTQGQDEKGAMHCAQTQGRKSAQTR